MIDNYERLVGRFVPKLEVRSNMRVFVLTWRYWDSSDHLKKAVEYLNENRS